MSLHFDNEMWICKHCKQKDMEVPAIKELGVLGKLNPKASAAHVKDVQDRRWHPTEKRMFYASKEGIGKTYFFPKGK